MSDRGALRGLPQVDALVREVPGLDAVGPRVARWLARREVDAARERVLAGGEAGDVHAAVARAAVALTTSRIRRVINATGVVLHTNLGRAPLGPEAADAVSAAVAATNVELDLGTGERGARAPAAATLAAALCETGDALVVNNNAAALLLALRAIARDREVIVSRGELIEIGGEFRLPDVMEASGAILREVGTTNRTHARDYRDALGDRTGLVLKVHPSNYRVVGFTTSPSVTELASIAHAGGVPLLYDIGSGLIDPTDGPLADEPDARSALAAGADLVCFSGDKLLGGPQAGVIAGDAALVERCRRDPLARAVRADKLTLAAMEATLWAHATGDRARIPAWSMLEQSAERIAARAEHVIAQLPKRTARLEHGESVSGGGSLPGVAIPTTLLVVPAERPGTLAAALRASDPPVIARVETGKLVLDLRTVAADDDVVVANALRRVLDG